MPTTATPSASPAPIVRELSPADHTRRQLERVAPDAVREALARVLPSGHFHHDDRRWHVAPYPGYAYVSMLLVAPENEGTIETLAAHRLALGAFATARPLLFPLPVASFHQTLANTLSAERLAVGLAATGATEDEFRAALAAPLDESPRSGTMAPVRMRLVGLSVFGASLGALGVFDEPADFERVLHFRDRVYGHPRLQALGVRRTRPFVGHVTLAYFDRTPSPAEAAELAALIDRLNRTYTAKPIAVTFARAEVRHFRDLATFESVPGLSGAAF